MIRCIFFAISLLLVSPTAAAQDNDDSAFVIDDDDSSELQLAAVVAVAPEISDEQAVVAVKTLLDHQQSGWGAIVAALLTLLIFAFRRAGALDRLPRQALPWAAAGIAMIGDVIAALSAGTSIPDALLQGLMLGAAAVGFWELALKHALGEKK